MVGTLTTPAWVAAVRLFLVLATGAAGFSEHLQHHVGPAAFVGYELTIDLERQVVVKADGTELPFEVQPFRKFCLLGGFDDIGLTLRHADKIRSFEAERLLKKPWLAHTL